MAGDFAERLSRATDDDAAAELRFETLFGKLPPEKRVRAVLRWPKEEQYPRIFAALDRRTEARFGLLKLDGDALRSDPRPSDQPELPELSDEDWLRLGMHVANLLAMILRCAWPAVAEDAPKHAWRLLQDGSEVFEVAWREIEAGIDLLSQVPASALARFIGSHDDNVAALRVSGNCWLGVVSNLYEKCIAQSNDRTSVRGLFGDSGDEERAAAANAVLQSVGVRDIYDLDALDDRIRDGLLQEFVRAAEAPPHRAAQSATRYALLANHADLPDGSLSPPIAIDATSGKVLQILGASRTALSLAQIESQLPHELLFERRTMQKRMSALSNAGLIKRESRVYLITAAGKQFAPQI